MRLEPYSIQLLVSTVAILVFLWVALAYPWIEQKLNSFHPAWPSFTGGAAAAYLLLYLIPKISSMSEKSVWPYGMRDFGLYLLSLMGLLTYLVLDVLNARQQHGHWRLGVLMGINLHGLLVGLLLIDLPNAGVWPAVIVSTGFLLHFMGLNHVFTEWKLRPYGGSMRPILALSMLTGWLLGLVIELPAEWLAGASAFNAGALMSLIMLEELPRGQATSLRGVVIGAASFGLVMLAYTLAY